MAEKNLTKKDLRELTGCAAYVIDYLYNCNRLPVVEKSPGRGYPTLYAPEAIDIVKAHIAKQSR